MNVLGVSLGHDSSVALVVDGKVEGVMEAERYFRQKRYKLDCVTVAPGQRPSGYQYVDVADLELFLGMVAREWGTAFDAVAVQNQGRRDEYDNLIALLARHGFRFTYAESVAHHLSHASLAFYTSPFEEAVVFSYDGFGNDGQTLLFAADGRSGLEYVERSPLAFGQSYNNLGYIAGIKPDISGTSSGKTMGLAAYGSARADWLPCARRYVREYRKLPPRPVEGLNDFGKAHRVNAIGLAEIPDLKAFVTAQPRETAPGLRGLVQRATGGAAVPTLRLPGPEDRNAQDLVHTVQAAWTEVILELVERHRERSRNLCVVGGCALNGITNYELQQRRLFAGTFFVPNPSDCGLSAGAALYVTYRWTRRRFRGYGGFFSPYLGTEPFDRDELPALRRAYPHRDFEPGEVPATLARLIHADRIVGVVRGRYEIGPRALGNRSILCNPLNSDIREILNRKVKHREWYRPFAPAVTAEDAGRFFTNTEDIPYMSVICYTRPEHGSRLPAVTHVDGSARVQTVRREDHPFLWTTLKEFERLAGVPILLNTSFNPRGEPILNYCAVALEMLRSTELDLVLIGDTLFARPGREELLRA
jgi:predicted NodU family carbamoyl transferase